MRSNVVDGFNPQIHYTDSYPIHSIEVTINGSSRAVSFASLMAIIELVVDWSYCVSVPVDRTVTLSATGLRTTMTFCCYLIFLLWLDCLY